MFGRFTEPAHQVLDLARAGAERAGHRDLGPEHVLLGLLAEGHSRAAQLLRAAGVELASARPALVRLVDRGVVPAPRPSDGELLGSLGIDLDAVRHQTEQRFGAHAVGEGQPAAKPKSSRRHRQVIAHVGLSDGYHGAAGPLLAGLEVDLGRLWEAVAAELRGSQR